MRPPLSFDDVEELEVTARTPKQHRAAAEVLITWAHEGDPDDFEVTPAALLVAAAEHLKRAGAPQEGLDLLRQAVAAPGEAVPDTRCWLHGALLEAGELDEARAIAVDVRHSAPDDPDVYDLMGENYEMVGDLREALRWFAMGLTRLEREGVEEVRDERHWERLVKCRRRVRHAMGYPPDDLDLSVPPPPVMDV